MQVMKLGSSSTVRHFALSLLCLPAISHSSPVTPTSSMSMLPVGHSMHQIVSIERTSNGVLLHLSSGVLRLQVRGDRIIRVTYGHDAKTLDAKSLAVIAKAKRTTWKLEEAPDKVSVVTSQVRATVNRATGAVTFSTPTGAPILQEAAGTRLVQPSGTIENTFLLNDTEAIYGLGQHPDGVWNYRKHTVHLQQKNTDIAIPVLVSSAGYGILWDNPSITDVDVAVHGDQLTWKSEAGSAIDYYLMVGPDLDRVVAGYRELTGAAPMMPKWLWGMWQCKERYESQKELLGIAKEYRDRKVPIDGIIQDWQYWTPGTWGSHEFEAARYPNPKELVKDLHELGFHTLISVWSRFDEGTTNEAELDKIGGLFAPRYKNVYPAGFGRWYDAYSASARSLYWKQISSHLFSMGWDGWWLDATEPELGGNWGEIRELKTGLGSGKNVANAYPLMTTAGVYQGQRADNDKKRVVILTRSAFAGQQRNSTVSWSGDIGGEWDVFGKQIAGGLNFCISGVPYWNTDIGGFFGHDPEDPKYLELFLRWFQFGSLNPMFRVHGTYKGKEYWKWNAEGQKVWDRYVALRYRLMPYIYSTSWEVTSKGSTMFRPLVMNYRDDAKAQSVSDQFMFGPSLMACPVTRQGAEQRGVYLPGGGAKWFDFWTGETFAGPSLVDAKADISTMPLYVPAGSIIPLGPSIQFTGEKPADPIELRIYPGANATYELYEDEGDGYAYEHKVYATIPISWDDKSRTLTVGKRKGNFPGMLDTRHFQVVLVGPGHGADVTVTEKPDATIEYSGEKKQIRL